LSKRHQCPAAARDGRPFGL